MKSKYWTFMMYKDSMPEDYREIIEKWCIPVAISPLHDKDKWTEQDKKKNPKHKAGTLKKAHYHVVIYYNNTTTYNKIMEMIKPLGAEYAETVISFKGMYEYLTHKNNKEKAQYDEKDIQNIGFNKIEDLVGYSESEQEEIKREIINLININNFYEFKEIYDYCLRNELYKCTTILSHASIFFENYLRSKRILEK